MAKMVYSHKNSQIQTPFLKLFLLYYGNVSIQLGPVYWNKWRSILGLAWNVGLITALYYVMFVQNEALEGEIKRDARLERVLQSKPLFAIVFTIGIKFVLKFSFILFVSYFIAIGIFQRELTYHLDAFRVDVFDAEKRSRNIFFILLAIDHFAFTLINLGSMLQYQDWANQSLTENMIEWATNYAREYILNLHLVMPFILVFYYKFCTFKSLKELSKEVASCQGGVKSISVYEFEIQRLAQLNDQLGSILSLPLFISIFNFVLGLIITLSCVVIHDVNLSLYVGLLQFVVYLNGITYLDHQIENALLHLCRTLQDRIQNGQVAQSNSIFSSEDSATQVKSHTSLEIRCKEILQVYRKYFTFKLFRLCRIDFGYICTITIFIVNYVVLLTQTSL